MISVDFVYYLMGLMMAGIAIVNLRDRSSAKRYNNAAFWGLYAITFLTGSRLRTLVNVLIVIEMLAVRPTGRLGGPPPEAASRDDRETSAARWGNKLFTPALTIPAVTLFGNWAFKKL